MAVEMLKSYASNLSAPLGLRPFLHYCACAFAIAIGLFFWGLFLAGVLSIEIRFSILVVLLAFWSSFAAILVLEVMWRPSTSLVSGIGFLASIGPSLFVALIASFEIIYIAAYLL
jgi:hypothetical protein